MIPGADYVRILPELILVIGGILIMLIEPVLGEHNDRRSVGALAFVATLGAVAATVFQELNDDVQGLGWFGMVRVDRFSICFHLIIGFVAAIVIMASFEYLKAQNIRSGEFFGLILLGSSGMMLMSSAVELVLIFIALEISSISTYVLAGFRRHALGSVESSIKYFLLGSFATAFFLYGVALTYGATGSTSIYPIAEKLRAGATPLAFAGMALMFVGLGFKVASAPFHVWTPDVYEGAPSPVVALMSTAPKAATFAVLLRILFAAAEPGWFWLVWVSAILSMCIGNLGALVQNNVKRMLAYSSIAHAGYLLVAFAAAKDIGISAAIFYAASYAVMNAGAFIVISHFGGHAERLVNIDDYSGLGRRSPALAAILTVFMLSLIGIPITGGFFAKFYVFSAALKSNLVGLVIVGVINSAIAAYYYLRVIVYMYMREPKNDAPIPMPATIGLSLAAGVLATIYLGVLPGRVLDYAMAGARSLVK